MLGNGIDMEGGRVGGAASDGSGESSFGLDPKDQEWVCKESQNTASCTIGPEAGMLPW